MLAKDRQVEVLPGSSGAVVSALIADNATAPADAQPSTVHQDELPPGYLQLISASADHQVLLQQHASYNFGTATNALSADDATASADAQPSQVQASPKQSPPAKTKRKEYPETTSALLPWPPNPISLRPPLPQTSSAATASADANVDGSLTQPRDALPPSKSTVEVREYQVEEDSSGSSSSHAIVQEVHHETKRAGKVINRIHLQKRTSSAPTKSLRGTRTSTSSHALASAYAQPVLQEVFRGDVTAYHRHAAEHNGPQGDPSPWDQQMSDLIYQVQILQFEKEQLQEVIRQREQGVQKTAQQCPQQATAVADQFKATAHPRDHLAQVRDQVRLQSPQHEQAHQDKYSEIRLLACVECSKSPLVHATASADAARSPAEALEQVLRDTFACLRGMLETSSLVHATASADAAPSELQSACCATSDTE